MFFPQGLIIESSKAFGKKLTCSVTQFKPRALAAHDNLISSEFRI